MTDDSPYEVASSIPGPPCSMPRLLEELALAVDSGVARPTEVADFRAALSSPKVQHTAIRNRLGRLGIAVTPNFVSRHRGEFIACVRCRRYGF